MYQGPSLDEDVAYHLPQIQHLIQKQHFVDVSFHATQGREERDHREGNNHMDQEDNH